LVEKEGYQSEDVETSLIMRSGYVRVEGNFVYLFSLDEKSEDQIPLSLKL